MYHRIALGALLLCGGLATGVAAGGGGPLADAGLDQSVPENETVHLDATGSTHPDGTIERYEWEIKPEGGEPFTPENSTSPRPEFVAEAAFYYVTVTVEDEAGRTAMDTLHVNTYETGPSVTLDGPTTPFVGTQSTYTARATGENVSLDAARWYLDGVRIEGSESELSGASADFEDTRSFPDSSTRQLEVVVEDAHGETATAALEITPRSHVSQPERTSEERSVDADPVVVGPKLLTGEKPLEGSYAIDETRDDISSVEWYVDGTRAAHGERFERTWSPGDHRLYAVVDYEDGETETARFGDGSETVTADPKPNVAIDEIDRYGSLTGEVSASDEYGPLSELSVHVVPESELDHGHVSYSDGQAALERTVGETDRVSDSFEATGIDGGEEYTVIARAEDERGQTATDRRSTTAATQPVVVSSEMRNVPVDSYHEKIDSERYTATQVVVLDLNGVDPGEVEVEQKENEDSEVMAFHNQKSRNYNGNEDKLVIKSDWAGTERGNRSSILKWKANQGKDWKGKASNLFLVEPSPPEIRAEIERGPSETQWVSERTPGLIGTENAVIDASESFDPDGSEIEYHWVGQYNRGPFQPTYEISDLSPVKLTVTDDGGRSTSRIISYADLYVPTAVEFDVVSVDPIADEVTVEVTTEAFRADLDDTDVRIATELEGTTADLDDWELNEVTEETFEETSDSGAKGRSVPWSEVAQYSGELTLPRSALEGETPTLVLYNEANPERPRTDHDVPTIEEMGEDSAGGMAEVVGIEYVVEEPVFANVTATTTEERDDYLGDGFDVVDVQKEQLSTVEKRQKVSDAVTRTETRSFPTATSRWDYVERSSEWSPAGTETTTATQRTRHTEWRSSRGGTGTFTGNTRQVQTSSAQYVQETRYRYEYTVSRTGTRTRMVCRGFICYTTTEEYTYYDTRTGSYWATSSRSSSHTNTGLTRRTQISSATYETQYEYEYYEEEEVETTRYLAEREVVEEPAQYKWVEVERTTYTADARLMARQDGYRMGGSVTERTWDLSKEIGTTETVVEDPEDPADVVETRVRIEQPDSSVEEVSVEGYFSESISFGQI